MAVKISELTTTTAVTGDEVVPAVKNGQTVGIALGDIVPIRRTPAEIAAGVTPTSHQYESEPTDLRRHGAVGNGTTDDSQAWTDALAASYVVELR